ncbi:MAG: hypothetical protein JWR83_212, partial [Aeromicrobium sp.]|nr:hypothetical protein [Aeromicrobium sp.]
MRGRPRRLAALTVALAVAAALSAGCAQNGDIVGGSVPASGPDPTTSTSKPRTVPAPTSPAVTDPIVTLPVVTSPTVTDPRVTAAPITSPATSSSVSPVEETAETPPETTSRAATTIAGPLPASA